jgi:hypothetical protein
VETNLSTSHSEPAEGQRLTPLWLFIIGVLVIELALRIMPEGFMTRTVQHRAEEVRYLPPADIQLVGDSATSAVRVALLERFLGQGHQVSNYALPGTSPLFNYFVLRRQIALKKAPKLIVLAPHPFTWGDPFLDRFMARFATPEESGIFLSDGVKFSDWLYGTLCRLSYTLRYREELYKFVTAGDTLFFTNLESPVSSVQNTRAKISFEEIEPPAPTRSVLSKTNVPPLLRSPIVIHPYNEMYLDKLCELAAANNIQIVWLTLPLPEMLRRDFPNPERTAIYEAFVMSKKAKHPNLHSIAAPINELPDTYYQDAWHMNGYGAWQFSQTAGKLLAEWLKEHPLEQKH